MPPTNKALILVTPKSPTQTISQAPYSSPSANELVIKAHAVAINPADWGIQRHGVLIPEDAYPCILGCDVAGEVVELPQNAADDFISHFKIGDRVIAQTGPLDTKDSTDVDQDQDMSPEAKALWQGGKTIYAYAAFQTYVVLRGPFIARIPDAISYEDAVVLPLGTATAASCLFPATMLNLDFPPLDRKADRNGKILLVWGASSSVGSSGVQLAAQAGYTVIGICSARNFAMVTSLGAVKCFEHTSPAVVDEVVSYVTASSHAGEEVVGAYDGISTAPTLTPLCEILHRLAATNVVPTRKFIAAVYPGAEAHAMHGVEIIVNLTQGMEQFHRTAARLPPWLERAMADGRIKCAPEKDVVGEGLEAVQEAMDRLAEGKVSGRKLVVRL
jgi:NADPH:quinone reductase-like Zn-dependent oxidoreductase